jgi:nuclear receptor interaction protein
VCDRRMLERQTPSWGPNIKESGQVHCVRRLGLTNEDWESAGVMQRGPFAEPRHITCVKMSPERADEVSFDLVDQERLMS